MSSSEPNAPKISCSDLLLMRVHDYVIQKGPCKKLWDELDDLAQWQGSSVMAFMQLQSIPFILPPKLYSPPTQKEKANASDIIGWHEVERMLQDFMTMTGAVDSMALSMLMAVVEKKPYDEVAGKAAFRDAVKGLAVRRFSDLEDGADALHDRLRSTIMRMVDEVLARKLQAEQNEAAPYARLLPVSVVQAKQAERWPLKERHAILAGKDYFAEMFDSPYLLASLARYGTEVGVVKPWTQGKLLALAVSACPEVEAYVFPSALGKDGKRRMATVISRDPLSVGIDKAMANDGVFARSAVKAAQMNLSAFEGIFELAYRGRPEQVAEKKAAFAEVFRTSGICNSEARMTEEQLVDHAYALAKRFLDRHRSAGQGLG